MSDQSKTTELEAAVEALLTAYLTKYGRAKGQFGVRANAPLQKEVGDLAVAFNAIRCAA